MSTASITKDPDIQGLLFRAYPALPHAGYGLFRIRDRAAFQAWLHRVLGDGGISTAEHGQPAASAASRLNIAFTASGFRSLLGTGWMPESFEPSFVEGMVEAHRSRLLGDVEANDPQHWRWGRTNEFDGVLMTFAATRDAAEELLADHLTSGNGAERIGTVHGYMDGSDEEAFGFKDGISQPVIVGTQRHEALVRERSREASLHGVAAGEIVLGYADGSGKLPRSPATSAATDPGGHLRPHWEWPERRDLGRNGSYLVFRQLAQDVDGFWTYLKSAATGEDGDTADDLAAKMVGRHKDGASLEPASSSARGQNNRFDFANDVRGTHCPIGSHIRRSNPRATGAPNPKQALQVTLRHRILRRGRPYRDDDRNEVGLAFLCFNASISRQFEFIQGSWCNNPFFDGLQREVDPIIGTPRTAGAGLESVDRFTIPRDPYRRLVSGLPAFVTVKGGGYFFLPSVSALHCLANAP